MAEQSPFNPLQRPVSQEPPQTPRPEAHSTTSQQTTPPQPEKPLEEKQEFLQREEVRTMGKDILKVRKEEAQQERDRISNIGTPQKKTTQTSQQQSPDPRLITPEEQLGTHVPLSPPPTSGDKTLVRTIIIGIVLIIIINVSALGYWFWRSAQGEEPIVITPPPAATQNPEDITPSPTVPEPPVNSTPPPALPTNPEPPTIPEPSVTPDIPPPSPTEPEPPAEPEPPQPPPPIIDPEPIIPQTLEVQSKFIDWGFTTIPYSREVDAVIIHSSYNALGIELYSVEGVLAEYHQYGVSAHYLIDREGIIHQLVDDNSVAWHAGVGTMPEPDGRSDINSFSIGIEVLYTKDEAPNAAQYQALALLTKFLQEAYKVPSANVVGHEDIAPNRKTDPWNFDWISFKAMINE